MQDIGSKRRKGRNEEMEDRLDMELRKDGNSEQWQKTEED